jgi:hypothetical protein
MTTIKLSDWCEKTGTNYMTAWRWFHNNQLPVPAYQTASGSIMVEEQAINNEETISIYLKKMSEVNQAGGTIEDFAAWTLSNFELKKKQLPTISEIKEEEVKITDLPNWQNLIDNNMFNSALPTTINSIDYTCFNGQAYDNFAFTSNQFTHNPNTACISSLMPQNSFTATINSNTIIPTITETQIEKPKRGRPSKNKDNK